MSNNDCCKTSSSCIANEALGTSGEEEESESDNEEGACSVSSLIVLTQSVFGCDNCKSIDSLTETDDVDAVLDEADDDCLVVLYVDASTQKGKLYHLFDKR